MADALVDALAEGKGLSDPNSILFMLIGIEAPFDGAGLIVAFDRAQTEKERSHIACIIAQSKATGVNEWLLRVARDRAYGKARIAVLMVSHLDRFGDWMNEPLLEAFEEKPVEVTGILGIRGGERELEFLKGKRGWKGELEPDVQTRLETALEKSIRRIERRLAKQRSGVRASREGEGEANGKLGK